MQAREGILEDHRDVLAPNLPEGRDRRGDQVLAHEPRRAGDPRALAVEQAQEREVRDALSRAGLPHDPERLAAMDGERQAVDGMDDAVRRRKLHNEVLDLEQRLGRHW